MQPRGRKTPQLIPEFKTVKTVLLPSIPTLEFKKKITSKVADIAPGSKLLGAEAKTGKDKKMFLCVFGV